MHTCLPCTCTVPHTVGICLSTGAVNPPGSRLKRCAVIPIHAAYYTPELSDPQSVVDSCARQPHCSGKIQPPALARPASSLFLNVGLRGRGNEPASDPPSAWWAGSTSTGRVASRVVMDGATGAGDSTCSSRSMRSSKRLAVVASTSGLAVHRHRPRVPLMVRHVTLT